MTCSSDGVVLQIAVFIERNAMALRDPVAVYNAATNVEVYLVQEALAAAGIEAFVAEDNSLVGMSMLGFMAEMHKPQVFVDKADLERARPVLVEFERRKGELAKESGESPRSDIIIECEDCGKRGAYSAVQRGSVQQCPHCGGFVDVEEDGDEDEWEITDDLVE